MAAWFRVINQVLKPTDTHCSNGEPCSSAKFCPENSQYSNGHCVAPSQNTSGQSSSVHVHYPSINIQPVPIFSYIPQAVDHVQMNNDIRSYITNSTFERSINMGRF